jgi:hypothetical protein
VNPEKKAKLGNCYHCPDESCILKKEMEGVESKERKD